MVTPNILVLLVPETHLEISKQLFIEFNACLSLTLSTEEDEESIAIILFVNKGISNFSYLQKLKMSGQQQLLELFNTSLDGLRHIIMSIPGSNILYKYIKNSHQNDPFR